jgi:hypothetical protein
LEARTEQPITDVRLERYRRHFGEDYWSVAAGSWVLIGANAHLFGSGLAAEDEQWSLLERSAAAAGTRPVAWWPAATCTSICGVEQGLSNTAGLRRPRS